MGWCIIDKQTNHVLNQAVSFTNEMIQNLNGELVKKNKELEKKAKELEELTKSHDAKHKELQILKEKFQSLENEKNRIEERNLEILSAYWDTFSELQNWRFMLPISKRLKPRKSIISNVCYEKRTAILSKRTKEVTEIKNILEAKNKAIADSQTALKIAESKLLEYEVQFFRMRAEIEVLPSYDIGSLEEFLTIIQ